jgi:geranylgeranyl pyrophosphate synthase
MHNDILPAAREYREAGAASIPRRTAWANRFAVMAGNNLLVRAYEIIADLGAESSVLVSRATADLSLERLLAAQSPAHLASDERIPVPIGEPIHYALSCRLGATLGGAAPAAASCTAHFGEYLGCAFQLTQEALRARAASTSSYHESCLVRVHDLIHQARQCLQSTPDSPNKDALFKIAQFLSSYSSNMLATCTMPT